MSGEHSQERSSGFAWRVLIGVTMVVFSIVAFHCAGQAPPSGGPPDTIPPLIISTYPAQASTDFRDASISFEFDEYVDRRSVEESIYISPAIEGLEFDWSGREVTLHFETPLAKNVTYVVTVGTDVVDVRARNRMAQSFTLAFSTGSTIDSASLAGRVFDTRPEGVTIFAYKLADSVSDTLDPSKIKPDYLTQSGSNGLFRLSHLAWGSYRLFAVRDEFKNLLYDPEEDAIGMASRDFEVNPLQPSIDGIQFRLARVDTSPPLLVHARAVNKNLLELRFNEVVSDADLQDVVFSIADSLTGQQVASREAFSTVPLPTSIQLSTVDLDSSRFYRIRVDRIRDTSGNAIAMRANTAEFQGSSVPDTIVPLMIVPNISDSMRNVLFTVQPELRFNDLIDIPAFSRGFGLLDSLRQSVAGRLIWLNPTAAKFIPRVPLHSLAWYTLKVVLDSLRDRAGNHRRDSVFTRSFQTIDWRKLGSMRGSLRDTVESAQGPIIVSVLHVSGSTVRRQYFDRPGDFTFEDLEEGLYRLEAFCDADSSGSYTRGTPFPFRSSERFTVYPDTIKVRARWPVEGIVIRFGEY